MTTRRTTTGHATTRRVLDVSALPTDGFGQRGLGWWATLGFMVIEGTTLAVGMAVYLYLRQNFPGFPPPRTALPSLGVPTANILLMLLSILPMVVVERASLRFDLRRIRIGLAIATLLGFVCVGLRFVEFTSLNVRWDSNAYGSAAWGVLGLHTSLLVVDALETAAFAVLAYRGPLEKKHFSDFEDAAFYQYFLSGANVLVWLLLFVSPRWL